MRHAKRKFSLNRFTSWRKATLRSLASSVIFNQRIQTTLAKAKAARPLVEKLIKLAKSNTLNARRQCFRILGSHQLVKKLFEEIGPLFLQRTSGFTRIIKLKRRKGDGAQLVIFELVENKEKTPKKKKEEKENLPEQKAHTETDKSYAEKKPLEVKPAKKFLGGIRRIFKKERDAL